MSHNTERNTTGSRFTDFGHHNSDIGNEEERVRRAYENNMAGREAPIVWVYDPYTKTIRKARPDDPPWMIRIAQDDTLVG